MSCVLCTMIQDGSTMLMEAAKGGHFETMSLLLDWPSSSSSSASQAAVTTDAAGKVVLCSTLVSDHGHTALLFMLQASLVLQ